MEPVIDAGICRLRPWRDGDVERLVEIANDVDVARYMADRFPHPYTVEDARWWINLHHGFVAVNNFAIEVDGNVAGGIGMDPHDGERRIGAIFGYWLGREYWGRGIATAACAAFTDYALNKRGFIRLEATVYGPNVASMRVLEKCGYVCEGTLRKSIIKDGQILDSHLYAKVKQA